MIFLSFCFPLRTGAFFVAAWVFIWHLYLGILELVNRSSPMTVEGFAIFIGVMYILLAFIAIYGARSIYYENLSDVKWFKNSYLSSLMIFVVLSFIEAVMLAPTSFNVQKYCESENHKHDNYCSYSLFFMRWGVNLAIGVIIGGYFYIVLRSYRRELEEKFISTLTSDV
ncbi:unnamed protein product [Rhizophagus irregularis]|nr:unnamed protein product [Rhizophagus irregularis]